MSSIKVALLTVFGPLTLLLHAGTLSWNLSGLVTCSGLDSTYTNLERGYCGMGTRMTFGGVGFSTSLNSAGGHVYELNGDVLNDLAISPTWISGGIGYWPADRLSLSIHFANAVSYSSAFTAPVTADMRYEGQSFHDIADGLTGTVSFIPAQFQAPITTIHNPEPRTTLVLALAFFGLGRLLKRRMLMNHSA